MFAKRIIALCLACVCCVLCGSGVLASESAEAPEVMRPQVDCDSTYCFSGEEFGQSLQGVCILSLPDSDTGTVMLGARVVCSGDILTAQQLSNLTFLPLRTETDVEATVTYLPIYENRVDQAASMTISIRGKEDKAPVAEDSVLETYKNLPNHGILKAYDPEGSQLSYSIIRQPKRGQVQITEDGCFTYTPKKNKVGTDSFTYTVTDASGNVSREATVTIQILKPSERTFYADTFGADCRFAAEWLKNTGLFVGETLGDAQYFQPEKTVSRAEFLTLLVQTLGLAVEETANTTGFADDCPSWLRPYLAAAQRAGLMAGWSGGDQFGAQAPVTGQEAALLLQNALDLPTTVMAEDLPMADRAVAVMAQNGVALNAQAALTRADVSIALYRVSQLLPTAPGMQVLAKQ